MSRSIHTTFKTLRGLTKKEIDGQSDDPYSDLSDLADKLHIRKSVVKARKQKKQRQTMIRQNPDQQEASEETTTPEAPLS